MDKLAAAHESAADVERAESLYLRMLAWREGADQFEAHGREAGNFEVGQVLFKKSSTYRSVEDATWFLHSVKPDDGHMGMEAIAFHSSNAELQAAGAGVLRLLCSGHKMAHRNRRRVVFLNGVESVLSAIQNFPDDCEVMREACGALRAMAHKNPVPQLHRLSSWES
eukprot:Skav207707  [mRNA]  locus=scaffold1833:73238:78190:+ [translate_table: standard]